MQPSPQWASTNEEKEIETFVAQWADSSVLNPVSPILPLLVIDLSIHLLSHPIIIYWTSNEELDNCRKTQTQSWIRHLLSTHFLSLLVGRVRPQSFKIKPGSRVAFVTASSRWSQVSSATWWKYTQGLLIKYSG
jgi:hypothetical protein